MKKINIGKYLRFGEKVLIISGLSFFSGIFGTQSMGIVLSEGLITFIRFSLWGIFTLLVFLFWQDAIAIINRNKILFILTAIAYFSFLWSDFPDYTFLNSRDILMMTNFGLYFAIRFSLKEQIKILIYTLLIGMRRIKMIRILSKVYDHRDSDSWANSLRKQRFSLFTSILESLSLPIKILDVGGTVKFWENTGLLDQEKKNIDITLLNLSFPTINSTYTNIKQVVGDARNMQVV